MSTSTPVDRLAPGDHACLTYSDHDDRLDQLAAFVAVGRERGERVICYTDNPLDLREREDFDDVLIAPNAELWGAGGPDAKAMVARLGDELEHAGGRGLRVTIDMSWAARPQANAEQLLAFEPELGKLPGPLSVVCEYDRESFDPVTLAYAARVHDHTIAATVYHEDESLRICRQHVPPGVRISGRLDFTHAEVLSDALAEAVRLDRDVHLNLIRLCSIDAGAASVIVQTAAKLPADRQMVVACLEPVNELMVDAPNLRLLVRKIG